MNFSWFVCRNLNLQDLPYTLFRVGTPGIIQPKTEESSLTVLYKETRYLLYAF